MNDVKAWEHDVSTEAMYWISLLLPNSTKCMNIHVCTMYILNNRWGVILWNAQGLLFKGRKCSWKGYATHNVCHVMCNNFMFFSSFEKNCEIKFLWNIYWYNNAHQTTVMEQEMIHRMKIIK